MLSRWIRIGLAKGKKNQKAVQEEFPTISNNGGVWSDSQYSVKQLVREESLRFPQIVKVTRGYQNGYYDNYDATLSKNQVLHVYDSAIQRRVEAVDSFGRNLSIPADFPLHVTPTEGDRAGDSLTLAEATVNLPVKVVVVRATSDSDDINKHVLTGQTLLLRKLANDVFLRACAITKGWIDSSRVLTIPSFTGIEFVVAKGIRGTTSAEWTDYVNMFSLTVRHLNFDLIRGPPEMFLLDVSMRESDVSESPYEELQLNRTDDEEREYEDGGGYENPSKKNTFDTHVYARILSEHIYEDTDPHVYMAVST